ncbi:aminotransferase class V-fold PLP-dependent enzyme [candidate division KSB1 bacterium]|nr:aminotransferase class V-fold PLP-dependent enzyme [candidate division KSB1 bacterium]
MIYFDNTATSFPKPPCVLEAMANFLSEVGANPGRSGHRLAIESGRIVYSAREAVAELFHVADPLRIVFTANVTEALNLALHGLLKSSDHVITSSMEHNSMMRPLRCLEQKGVELTVVPCSQQGALDPADIESAIRPNTVMIAINHASNIVGTILPIQKIGQIARKHDLLFLVDAAQTAGVLSIDMERDGIDLLGFTGHKSLYGPMGTGGLIIGERVDLSDFEPIKCGGTGSRSEHEQQPEFLPDKFESGTPNAVGLAGLNASLRWILDQGIDQIRSHEIQLTRRLLEGLTSISGVSVYGVQNAEQQIATVSFNIRDKAPSEIGLRLDEEFGVLCRVGLHCSPASHKTIGTFPAGTVRFGLGFFNTADEIDIAIAAVRKLAEENR